MKKLYERIGCPWSEKAENQMRQWIEENQKHKYGTHSYTLQVHPPLLHFVLSGWLFLILSHFRILDCQKNRWRRILKSTFNFLMRFLRTNKICGIVAIQNIDPVCLLQFYKKCRFLPMRIKPWYIFLCEDLFYFNSKNLWGNLHINIS